MPDYFGLYRAIVVDNTDQLGQLKVICPDVYPLNPDDMQDIKSRGFNTDAQRDDIKRRLIEKKAFMARPCFPWGGDGLINWAIPRIGSQVFIQFEAGKASFPVWMGIASYYKSLPEGLDKDIQTLRTENHLIEISDKKDLEQFHYKNLKNNFEITIDKDGKLIMSIPDTTAIDCVKDLSIAVSDGKFTIVGKTASSIKTTEGALEIEAVDGNLTLKKGSTVILLDGSKVDINGGNFTVDA